MAHGTTLARTVHESYPSSASRANTVSSMPRSAVHLGLAFALSLRVESQTEGDSQCANNASPKMPCRDATSFALPLLAAAYCLFVWIRKADGQKSWVGFFASTMSALVLLTYPVMIAAWLPLIDLLQRIAHRSP